MGESLLRDEQPHGREHSHDGAGTGAARGSIDLRLRKDRHITQVGIGRNGGTREDRSVDTAQRGLDRMLDTHQSLDRVLDCHSNAPQVVQT